MNRLHTWAQLLPRSWVCSIATLGRLGSLKAPGTWGSAAGVVYYTVFFYELSPLAYLAALMGTVWLSIGICEQAQIYFGAKDPGYIILDECVAVPLCFFPITNALQKHPTGWVVLLGFALFRFFDILKPLGIKRIQEISGGLGVVLDDVAAAAATCLLLHISLALI